jgi:predicted hydrolase (HD superfamily)
MDVMNWDHTIEFLRQHVKTEMLMKHLYTVETGVRKCKLDGPLAHVRE